MLEPIKDFKACKNPHKGNETNIKSSGAVG